MSDLKDLQVTITALDEHRNKLVAYSFLMNGADFAATNWGEQVMTYKKLYPLASQVELKFEFLKGWDWK